MRPGPKTDPAARRVRARERERRGIVRRGEGPGVRGRAELRHSAVEGEVDTILHVVDLSIAEIEQHGLVTRTKRSGGKLNPAFSSLKDALRLLDYIPSRDIDEDVERLQLSQLVARLEAIALEATKE